MKNSRTFTIFAGVNGAGKSTLFHSLGKENFGVRLNTDEMVALNGNDWKNPRAQLEASRMVLKLQEECIEKGLDFNRETTLPGSNIFKTIEKAKKHNYKVHLYYVGLDSVETARSRVKSRVEHGGHGVYDEFIDIRFNNMESRLMELFPLCDDIKLFDNSKDSIEMVAYQYKGEFVRVRKDCEWLNSLLSRYENVKMLNEANIFELQ